MKGFKLLGAGIAGIVVTAICCFTPLLVIVLGSLGLAAWANSRWLDVILLGLLAFFMLLTALAVIRCIRLSNRSDN